MRQFTKIAPEIWSKAAVLELTDREKLLLLYLMTCCHQESCGCARILPGYIASDLDWQFSDVESALISLEQRQLIVRVLATNEIYVTDWFSSNPPMNPKHLTGVNGRIEKIHADELRERVRVEAAAASENMIARSTTRAEKQRIEERKSDLVRLSNLDRRQPNKWSVKPHRQL